MPLVTTASRFDFPQLGFELTFQLGHIRSWKGQRVVRSPMFYGLRATIVNHAVNVRSNQAPTLAFAINAKLSINICTYSCALSSSIVDSIYPRFVRNNFVCVQVDKITSSKKYIPFFRGHL